MTLDPHLLATMVTITTYGTWLPGDTRGYVDRGCVLPGDPKLEASARRLLVHHPVILDAGEQLLVGQAILGAVQEFGYTLHAMSVERWHVHMLLSHGYDKIGSVVARLKVRSKQAWHGEALWGRGYDKRFCFSQPAFAARQRYIEHHEGWRSMWTWEPEGGS